MRAVDMFIASENAYKEEIFSRGYIFCTKNDLKAPDNWDKDSFHDLTLASDPKLPKQKIIESNISLLCLGVIFDVRYPEEASLSTFNRLKKAIQVSEDNFFYHLSYTSGRYIIAYRRKDEDIEFLTDATGMKSIFYYNFECRILSSHATLVASNAKKADTKNKLETFRFGYPGIRTPFNNVYLLTPNTKLNAKSFEVERFWPLKPIKHRSIEEASIRVSGYLKSSMDYVAKFHTPIVSVTAGLDSRVTLSLNQERDSLELFTYYRADDVDSDALDRAFSEKFSSVAKQQVNILELRKEGDIPKEFKEMQKVNTYSDSLKRAAWVYYKKYRHIDDALHIRSNLSEIGREFWKYKKGDVLRGIDLAKLYLYGSKDYKAKYVFDVIDMFDEFEEKNKIINCGNYLDVKSLFYWEFRMAAWHSQVVVESDPAFDTISLYNCRKLLELMISIPEEDRKSSMLLRKIIESNWEDLTEYEVNGRPFWPDR